MERAPAFSWFPGHMRAAWRRLQQDVKLADALLFVLDARAPAATRHPDLERTLGHRPLLLVLNKSDLADEAQTKRWLAHFQQQGVAAVALQSRSGSGAGPLKPALQQLSREISRRREGRGIASRDTRLMVAGLPNVGKSTLLNRLVGRTAAKTGKKPGLTRGSSQWIAGMEGFMVLDSPGITYPRIDRQEQLAVLAAIGCLKADVLPLEEVAEELIELLQLAEPGEGTRLEALARSKGMLLPGAEPDRERAARWLLAATLEGRLGRVTLDRCPG